MSYFWFKVFHIVFIASWFAGLFYLPRIYVNMAQYQDNREAYDVLLGMARRLLRFTQMLSVVAITFGVLMAFTIGWSHGWLHAKIALTCGLLLYQYNCQRQYKRFERYENQRSHTFYRWYNEIPVVVMVVVVYLVIFKPF